MISSDKKIDNALGDLASVAPLHSAWPAIEQHLEHAKNQQRHQRWLRYSVSAMAASLLLAVVLVAPRVSVQSSPADLQQTVDAAIRDARPQATFSDHQFSTGKNSRYPHIDTLLVSVKPRAAGRGMNAGDTSTKVNGSSYRKGQEPSEREAQGLEQTEHGQPVPMNEF